jgi:threonine/homoserine/homoserine lactone efflux protein
MTPDLALAVALFAFVTTITPGPNNAMLLASGIHHGFRRSLPHMLGIVLGFALLLLAVGLGLGRLFVAMPIAHLIMRGAAGAYLLWLAARLAWSATEIGEGRVPRPMALVSAAAFQWVNPKTWVMATGAVAAYLPAGADASDLFLIMAVFAAVGFPCHVAWVGFGGLVRQLLSSPARLRACNIAMALLMVVALYPVLASA